MKNWDVEKVRNDDVKCAHGATVGQLEEEELFYLLTRGLPEVFAKNLFTYAFAEQIINKIGIESIMLRIIFGVCLIVLCGISIAGQANPARDPGIKTIELYSPLIVKAGRMVRSDPELRKKRCLNFVRLDQTCRTGVSISYGSRIGDNWDIFDFSAGPVSQSRMINIGKHDWTDEFTLSPIEPLSKLAPGESRALTIALYGSDGKPGRNGDGTYPKVFVREGNGNKPLDQQVHASITKSGRTVRGDKYMPLSEVKKGDMYLVRVVDPKNDFYVLLRVDDLVRGTKVTLSYWKWEPSRPIF